MQNFKALFAGAFVTASLFGTYQATHQEQTRVPAPFADAGEDYRPRTLVVNIGSPDPVKAVNGLLFALHSLRNARGDFGGEPWQLDVRVAFGGQGVLHASSKIDHPLIRIQTLPDDPVKTTDALIAALVAEGVEVRASGFGLKHYDVAGPDLLPGVMPAGPPDHPRFLLAPDSRNTTVVNF